MRRSFVMAANIATTAAVRPTVIFLHGSGDTGRGVEGWLRSLAPPDALAPFDWEFPTAEPIPYALAGGQVSSVWYDRVGGFEPHHPEQTESVESSASRILALIDAAVKRGVPPSKIAVGGFSMGGNLAYQTAARYHAAGLPPLGAVVGLSCYSASDSRAHALLKGTGDRWPETYVAHGSGDDFILPAWGSATYEALRAAGVDASFRHFSGAHEMTAPEIADVLAFLRRRLLEGGGTCA
jgi:phospholipase/carboxylesterase